jgi:hypothetical protein
MSGKFTSRTVTSRKVIFALAAAAALAAASLASGPTYARPFGGGQGGHGGQGGQGGHVLRLAFGGQGGRGGHVGKISFGGERAGKRGIRPLHPIRDPIGRLRPPRHRGVPPVWVLHHHRHHHHWVFRGGRWIILDEPVIATPVVEAAPGPCTCLTKTYTPSGLVVFADVCTKESASAPATSDTSDATQVPTSPVAATAVPIGKVPTAPDYAGLTYEDYLAANPQAAIPQAAPSAPQNN